MKRIVSLLIILLLLFSSDTYAAEPNVSSPSAILMEQSTGKTIYEKNADEPKSPASVTKLMTLYLIFDKLNAGTIKLEDEVVTSARAKSMGGSQVFLEEGEIQTVDTLIKCITVASGNDASVAMAEYISGTEESFVELMNETAKNLGLVNSHFIDCCGLTDDQNHYMSARDIAVLARELVNKYPEIFNYSGIWMEDITHVTNQGSSVFTLSNTNKLLKQYPYTTGLKTGSTSIAKFCLCATATKDDLHLISVVMAAPDPKTRFSDSADLLNYGFSVCRLFKDEVKDDLQKQKVSCGKTDEISIGYETDFTYLDTEGIDFSQIRKDTIIHEDITAPIKEGDILGDAVYFWNKDEIGRVHIIALETIEKATLKNYIGKVFNNFLL